MIFHSLKDQERSMKTAADIKADFIRQGITIANWAKARGYSPLVVYQLLNGRLKGRYGISHKIAIELGLKEKPVRGKRAA